MGKDWAWKKLLKKSSARLSEADRPDTMINRFGERVRSHAAHPITAAIERFMRKVRIAPATDSDLGECWLWQGGDTFRVSVDSVTTPRRYIYEYSMGEKLPENVVLLTFCKVGSCCRPGHLKPVETAKCPKKRFT